MSISQLTPELLRGSLLTACSRLTASREQLCALDASAGDGDLGATLATGFAAVADKLREIGGATPGVMFAEVGSELARKAPSTMGTLLAWAHIVAGRELGDASVWAPADVAKFLRTAQLTVSDRGKAQPGERTILDAMLPSAEAAERAAADGGDVEQVFRSAAQAAAVGAHETRFMSPRHGRAGWIGERAKGEPDGGATAWAIYVSALADGLSPISQTATSRNDSANGGCDELESW